MKKRYLLLSAAILLLVAVLTAVITLKLTAPVQPETTPTPAPTVWGSVAEPEASAQITEIPADAPAETPSAQEPESAFSPESLQESPAQPETPIESPELSEPELTPEDSGLRALLEAELATCSGSWSLYYENLSTGTVISIGDGPMVAASLIKLFVAGAYCQAAELGEVPDTCRDDLDIMLSQSSNEACNRLITLLGMERINRFIDEFGAENSQLNRKMLQTGEENYTSPADCGAVLRALLEGTFVSEAASLELLGYLENQERTHKIPAGIPAGVETANKTGELSDVENDVAIVWSEAGTYILVIMSDDVSPGTAQNNIVGISRMVYEYLNP